MVILGIGSNLGDRRAHIDGAIALLGDCLGPLTRSPIYESAALLLPDAPLDWNRNFLNLAVKGDFDGAPEALLSHIKSIEARMGRHDRGRWSPREIDIDLLAMDNKVFSASGLSIPHPELLNRDFALLPLADIAPDWCFPGLGEYHGQTASRIAASKGWMLQKWQAA